VDQRLDRLRVVDVGPDRHGPVPVVRQPVRVAAVTALQREPAGLYLGGEGLPQPLPGLPSQQHRDRTCGQRLS